MLVSRWTKPIAEQYREGFLDVSSRGLTFTTAVRALLERVGSRAGELPISWRLEGARGRRVYQSSTPDDSPASELVATLAELATLRTSLDEPVVDHLLRLTASWSLLATSRSRHVVDGARRWTYASGFRLRVLVRCVPITARR